MIWAGNLLASRFECMRKKDRYDTADLDEDQFEPGSRGRVLKNLLHITSKREMDRAEGREQVRALEELASLYDRQHRFTAADICRMHQIWLRSIYSWAGKYRQVNVKKGEFSFAAAAQIPKLMAELEAGALTRYTPCRPASTERLAGEKTGTFWFSASLTVQDRRFHFGLMLAFRRVRCVFLLDHSPSFRVEARITSTTASRERLIDRHAEDCTGFCRTVLLSRHQSRQWPRPRVSCRWRLSSLHRPPGRRLPPTADAGTRVLSHAQSFSSGAVALWRRRFESLDAVVVDRARAPVPSLVRVQRPRLARTVQSVSDRTGRALAYGAALHRTESDPSEIGDACGRLAMVQFAALGRIREPTHNRHRSCDETVAVAHMD